MTVVSVFCIMYLSLYTRKRNAPVWADPEGGQGSSFPLKNHKNKGFLSNAVPDRLKKHKATKPAFIVGPSLARQRNAI